MARTQVRIFYLTPSRQLGVQDVEEIIDAGQRCLSLSSPKKAPVQDSTELGRPPLLEDGRFSLVLMKA